MYLSLWTCTHNTVNGKTHTHCLWICLQSNPLESINHSFHAVFCVLPHPDEATHWGRGAARWQQQDLPMQCCTSSLYFTSMKNHNGPFWRARSQSWARHRWEASQGAWWAVTVWRWGWPEGLGGESPVGCSLHQRHLKFLWEHLKERIILLLSA